MARRFGFSVSCSLGLVVFLLLGCRRSQESSETYSLATQAANLSNINISYCMFCEVNGRGPANVDELFPYLDPTGFLESKRKLAEERLRLLKQGEIILVWNQAGVSDAKKGTDLVTAYEKRTAVRGGLVVFADGRVEWKTPAELESILKRVKTVSPEGSKLKLDLPDKETMKSELEKALKNIDNERSKKDLVNLQGLWEIVDIKHGKVALLGPARVGDPVRVVGDKLHFKHKTWEAESRFKLDANKDPKWIDTFVVEGEGEGIRGIYSLTQDEFKLCYDPSSSTRPTEFNTNVDFVRALFILKRVTPKR